MLIPRNSTAVLSVMFLLSTSGCSSFDNHVLHYQAGCYNEFRSMTGLQPVSKKDPDPRPENSSRPAIPLEQAQAAADAASQIKALHPQDFLGIRSQDDGMVILAKVSAVKELEEIADGRVRIEAHEGMSTVDVRPLYELSERALRTQPSIGFFHLEVTEIIACPYVHLRTADGHSTKQAVADVNTTLAEVARTYLEENPDSPYAERISKNFNSPTIFVEKPYTQEERDNPQ